MSMNSTLLIRLDDDLRRAIDAAAAADARTSSAYVRKVVMDHLQAKGLLKVSKPVKSKRSGRK